MKRIAATVFTAALCAGLAVLSGCGPAQQGNVVSVTGSDTMLHLTQQWAEAFNASQSDIVVTVAGGGSGVGVAALINGTTDICMSSRDLTEEEMENAEAGGAEIVVLDVALDGIAMVVHPENPVDVVDMDQLKAIYTGAVTDWSEVGGESREIMVLSRESSSGTYGYFREFVLDNDDYTDDALLLPSTTAIIQSVAQDAGAIGYVGLGYAESQGDAVKILPVKADSEAPAVTPTNEAIASGEYPIARPLHFYHQASVSEGAKAFADFCLSEAGQEIVVDALYVPIS